MKRRQWLYLVAGAVLIMVLFVWAFMPSPMPVEVAYVSEGYFEQTIDEDGKTQVRNRYVISAPLSGRLTRISLRAGDGVQAGQPVAHIAPTQPALLDARTVRELQERLGAAQAAYAQAQAEQARVQAALAQAQADLNRQKKLEADGFVSIAMIDQAQLAVRTHTQALKAAQSARDVAGHNVAQARAALARVQANGGGNTAGDEGALPVIAPITGQVLRVVQQSEAVVPIGAPLLEVGQTDDLEVVVDVLSTDALRIQSGMHVHVYAGSALHYEGTVRRVEPGAFTKVSALGVEEQRVNVVIDLPADASQQPVLGDGFRVDAEIVVLAKPQVVRVPVAALFRQGGQAGSWAVFVVRDGRAHQQVVRIGARSLDLAWVEEGLAVGDAVIVYPADTLADGARVRMLRANDAA